MFSLCWSVDELERLNETGHKLHVEIGALLVLVNEPSTDFVRQNIAQRLTKVRDDLLPFIKGVTRHRRHPATRLVHND